jgi:hypothetical protein
MITQANDWFLRYVTSNENGQNETYIMRVVVWRQSLTGSVTALFPDSAGDLSESEHAYNGGTYLHKDELSPSELEAANTGYSVELCQHRREKQLEHKTPTIGQDGPG